MRLSASLLFYIPRSLQINKIKKSFVCIRKRTNFASKCCFYIPNDMKTKVVLQPVPKKSKGDRLGWTPRNDVHKTSVCVIAKGEIVSTSVCHISSPTRMVR